MKLFRLFYGTVCVQIIDILDPDFIKKNPQKVKKGPILGVPKKYAKL